MRHVQVRAELGIPRTVEPVTGQAVLLEQGKALAHRAFGRQLRVREQRREALFHRRQAADRGNLERPLLGADAACLWGGPHQVERPGAWLAVAQCRPRCGGVLDGQPGACRAFLKQRRGRHFGSETVQRHGLQVVICLYALQQRGQRHRAVTHGPFIGHVLLDVYFACLRHAQQIGAVQSARRAVEFQVQLGRRKGQAQKKG
ncbi:hypothetical protein D3C73_1036590 [compost metagenome]